MTTSIVIFAASLRKGSFNKNLIDQAAKCFDESDVALSVLNLADYPLPLYDANLEEKEGIVKNAALLREKLVSADGFLIASPEYNSSFSPLLKNVIDWVSRPDNDVPGLIAFKNKSVGLMSASPGALGGLRGLVMLRMVLGNIGCHVMADQFTLPNAHEAFTEGGALRSEKLQEKLKTFVEKFTLFSKALKSL